jgi:hypothetical protein
MNVVHWTDDVRMECGPQVGVEGDLAIVHWTD